MVNLQVIGGDRPWFQQQDLGNSVKALQHQVKTWRVQ
jgi:hypothetical protein